MRTTFSSISVTVLVASGAAVLFAQQLWLIRHRDPALCFKAFLRNNAVGLIIFLGM